MYTKEINGKLCEFNFGLGFVREIDKSVLVEGDDKRKHKMGLTYAIAGLMDCDYEKLIDCLLIGSKFAPGDTLSRQEIEDWMDSEEFDLEKGDYVLQVTAVGEANGKVTVNFEKK